MKPLDKAYEKVLEMEIEAGKFKPILDVHAKNVEQIDNKIAWFEGKIKELEEEKQKKLREVSEIFDTVMISKHKLSNGYTIKPDNRYDLVIDNVGEFLKWMKLNCEPQDVLGFFSTSIKVASLKSFCNKEINKQRLNGEILPSIDGITINDVNFRRLTTTKGKKK